MQPAVDHNANELATVALTAIQTISSVAQTTLTALGIFLAICAFFGGVVIYRGCISAVKRVAEKKFKDYMETEDFHNLLKEKISKGMDERFRNTVFVNVQPEQRPTTDTATFREPPGGQQ
jgi:hypothetical protein